MIDLDIKQHLVHTYPSFDQIKHQKEKKYIKLGTKQLPIEEKVMNR